MTQEKQKEMTIREKGVVIALMATISFASNTTVSLVLPFLPQELNAMGLNGQLITGFVFGIFPATILILSPLCNYMAHKLGRIPLLYIGVPLQAAMAIVFGYAPNIASNRKVATTAIFLGTRAIQGFGAACANLSIFAIVADHFQDSLGKVMGFNEVIIGFGFMLGPVVGSVLYDNGGFCLPFIAASIMLLVSLPFVVMYHIQQSKREKLEAPEMEEPLLPEIEKVKPTLLHRIRRVLGWRMILTAMVLFLGAGLFGWVETILSLHLENDLQLKQKYIGLTFATINVTYSGIGPFIGAFSDKYGYKPVLVSGILISGIILILLGPVGVEFGNVLHSLSNGHIATLQARRAWEITLLALLGISQALALIPTLPAMKESVVGSLDKQDVNTVVMIFNQFQQAGLVFSPPITGAIAPTLGFATTIGIYGYICTAFGAFCTFMFVVHGALPRDEAIDKKADNEYDLIQHAAPESTTPLLVPQIKKQSSERNLSNSYRSPLCEAQGKLSESLEDSS